MKSEPGVSTHKLGRVKSYSDLPGIYENLLTITEKSGQVWAEAICGQYDNVAVFDFVDGLFEFSIKKSSYSFGYSTNSLDDLMRHVRAEDRPINY
ncbi:MAG: hypothetical protein AB4050_04855 [Synechococcus sp.]